MRPLDRLLRWVGLDFDLDLHSPRFDAITEQLTLGARPRPEDVDALQQAGVSHIVICLDASERPEMAFLDAAFQTRFLPLHDGIHQDLTPAFPTFFADLDGLDRGARLLVHCEVGVSRSATLAIAHVMRSTGQRFDEAFRTVQARRPHILPNIGFASQLQHLEHALQEPRPPGERSSLAWYLHAVCKTPVEPTLLQDALVAQDFDAHMAIRSLFGGEVPRVVQGVRN
ncbi:MAG: dual specificity protein phosphatase [Myxococcota bacterium]